MQIFIKIWMWANWIFCLCWKLGFMFTIYTHIWHIVCAHINGNELPTYSKINNPAVTSHIIARACGCDITSYHLHITSPSTAITGLMKPYLEMWAHNEATKSDKALHSLTQDLWRAYGYFHFHFFYAAIFLDIFFQKSIPKLSSITFKLK